MTEEVWESCLEGARDVASEKDKSEEGGLYFCRL